MNAAASAATAAKEKTTSTRLRDTDVEYLALEGGGGKGFAYLGAIDMLERKGVLGHVKGFAGASAGAITAFLLSIGYDYARLSEFLATTDFDEFYDPPLPRIVPAVATPGLPVDRMTPAEVAFMRGDIAAWLASFAIGDGSGGAPSFARRFLGSSIANSPLLLLAQAVIGNESRTLIEAALRDLPVPAVGRALLRDGNLTRYLAFLPRDMGLFSGAAARALFERLLQRAAAAKLGGLPSTYRNMGFAEHYRTFGKDLLFTGTNLRSGTTQLFSRTTTPWFPVADAVRISMGLPWVFKPYVITSQPDTESPPCGVYVDGGVWNNLPFREFDSAAPTQQDKGSAASAGKGAARRGPRTLGLRLEITPVASIAGLGDLTSQMLMHGVLGSGESQVLDKYTEQCVVLDTRGLDLLTFSPPKDPAAQKRISDRSRRAMCRYFGWRIEDVEPSIVDDADDAATQEALRAATACS